MEDEDYYYDDIPDEFFCPHCGAMDKQEDIDLPNDEGIGYIWVRSCDCDED